MGNPHLVTDEVLEMFELSHKEKYLLSSDLRPLANFWCVVLI